MGQAKSFLIFFQKTLISYYFYLTKRKKLNYNFVKHFLYLFTFRQYICSFITHFTIL